MHSNMTHIVVEINDAVLFCFVLFAAAGIFSIATMCLRWGKRLAMGKSQSQGTQTFQATRTVAVQSMTTYTSVRGHAHPRFCKTLESSAEIFVD